MSFPPSWARIPVTATYLLRDDSGTPATMIEAILTILAAVFAFAAFAGAESARRGRGE